MSRFVRILGAFALAASLLWAAGCSSPACPDGCPVGQVCDANTNSCVTPSGLCSSDAECGGTKPKCEVSLGVCVGCLEDVDCNGGRCDTSIFKCVKTGCTRGADCAATPERPYCSADGQCVECLTSSQCLPLDGVRRTCDLGLRTCIKNPCKVDNDCALDASGGRLCDTTTGGCVACMTDAQCTSPAQPHCLTESHHCVECASDANCDEANGETCTPDTHVCKVTRCVSDANCDGALKCDVASGQCVGCVSNADCSFGGICESQQCVQPATCASSSECLYGTFCQNGACVQCRTANDCRAGQTCNSGTCQEPATCTDSTACGPGRICTAGACTASECAADSSEPNDAVNLATPVRASTAIRLSAGLCPNEVDYYVLTFPEDSGGRFTVTYASSAAPLSLELILGPGDPPLRVVGSVERPGLVSASIESAPAGSRALLVKVSGGNGTAVPYTLGVDVQVGGICVDDGREPDGAVNQAPAVAPGSLTGVLCPKDKDLFYVDVPEKNRLSVAYTSDTIALGSTVQILYNDGGNLKTDVYGSTNGLGSVTVTAKSSAPAGGRRYWVQLISNSQLKIAYTANVSLLPDAPPNDDCATPLVLNPLATNIGHNQGSSNSTVASCGGQGGDSFWSLTLAEASVVKLDLAADFDSVLSIASSCASSDLACSSASGAQQLSFEALPAGTYLVRVAGKTASDAGDYSLSAQVSPAQSATVATCAAPVALSPSNGTATVAGSIALASNGVTSSCGKSGGDAVYSLTLNEDHKVRLELDGFPGASVSLVPEASCAAATGFCSAAGNNGLATLDRNAVAAGNYRVIVDGGDFVAGDYSLKVTLFDPIYPPANDVCGDEIDLSGGTVTGDTRGADDDYVPACGAGGVAGDAVYVITVGPMEEQVILELNASFDAALVVTEAACGAGTVVACESGTKPRVVLPVLPTGTYYVWVDGYATGSGTFSLKTTRAPAPPPPDNDLCADATVVDLSLGSATVSGSTLRATDDLHPAACFPAGATRPLQLTGGDVAYAVTVPAGKTLSALLQPHDFDGALYVLETCASDSCVAGVDASLQSGGSETLSVPNTGSADRVVVVVVDSWQPKAIGTFDLSFELQ
jgi:hypothetical protein